MSSRKLVEGWIKYLREDVGEAVAEVDSAPVEEAGGSWSEIRPVDPTSFLNDLANIYMTWAAQTKQDVPDEVSDSLSKVQAAMRNGGVYEAVNAYYAALKAAGIKK